ncbi:MAG: hypothetical protein K2M91_13570, partial [Lachnospiraceae bacterium]|nr:hypothetical protein [Lachnospiraceae bacterium]
MNKKRIFVAAVVICLLIMIQQYQIRKQKMADSPIDIETAYEMLNQDIFGNRTIDWYSDALEKELHEFGKEVRGEFVPVEYNGNLFPPELVAMMEEELYRLEKTDGEIDDTWYDPWYEALEAFGAGDFILGLDDLYQFFPELNEHRDEIETVYDAYRYISPEILNRREYCEEIFHFSMEQGKDNYLFLYEAGGETYRDYVVWLTEKTGDQFVTVDKFETRNYGGGEVIQYEGAY